MIFVKPSPFNILPKVLEINTKGQSQARVVIKSPAEGELKKYEPIKWPNNMKKVVHNIPKAVQYFNVFMARNSILC